MASGTSLLVAARDQTPRQRSRRRRSRSLSLRTAVRRAVDVFFRFTHSTEKQNALWSETERVWLGRATYLDWALSDPNIDVPWVVAKAVDAPKGFDDLVTAVRAELTAYWRILAAKLPLAELPTWLPLP
jgi:hypothetical protein